MIRSRAGRVKGACGAAARALRAPMTRPPARRIRQPSGTGSRLSAPPDTETMTAQAPCGHRRMQVRRIRIATPQAGALQNVTSALGCGDGAVAAVLSTIVRRRILMAVCRAHQRAGTPGRRPSEQLL